MRILLVSPYPPIRDGIGAYAVQQGIALRAQGHHVEVVSPLPSAADHHLELRGWRGPLALAKWTPQYDRVIVNFHLDMFYPIALSRCEKVAVTAGLIVAFSSARSVDLIIHEIDYNWGRRQSMRRLTRAMLRSATRVLVHTGTERRALCEAFGLPLTAVTVIEHGGHFVRRTNLERGAARALLGVPDDAFAFLAIGFLQPHKGFDRAIRAFGNLGSRGCLLYVVGSVRVEEQAYVMHLAELRRLVAEQQGVLLRVEYVSDERFDEWLVAANVVVLPYRQIWSSSVLERARLYDRPVIASDVGGLRDQRYPGVVVVDSDEELATAMHKAAGAQVGLTATSGNESEAFLVPLDTDRAAVVAMMRQRASRNRRPPLPSRSPLVPPREVLPLLRLAHLGPPPLESRSSAHRLMKRLVNRVVRWQTEPLRLQVNALRDATLEAMEALAAPQEAGSSTDHANQDGG